MSKKMRVYWVEYSDIDVGSMRRSIPFWRCDSPIKVYGTKREAVRAKTEMASFRALAGTGNKRTAFTVKSCSHPVIYLETQARKQFEYVQIVGIPGTVYRSALERVLWPSQCRIMERLKGEPPLPPQGGGDLVFALGRGRANKKGAGHATT